MNDINRDPFEQAGQLLDKNLAKYRVNGKLALAADQQEWAEIYTDFHQYPPGLFTFQKCTYYGTVKVKRSGGETYIHVDRCIGGTIHVQSYTVDKSSNPAKPTYKYNLTIEGEDRRPITVTAAGKDLASARALNEFLLDTAKIPWEGDPKATTAMQVRITKDKKAYEVQLLPVIGFQPDAEDSYVFHQWAVSKTGSVVRPDPAGNFRISHNYTVKPPPYWEGKSISPVSITKNQVRDIYTLFRAGWGENGVIAFSWAVTSWFSYRIKKAINLLPHLSCFGAPSAGKSDLVTLLNAMQGHDGEGIPNSGLNSHVGPARSLAQVSGLFVALLEGNSTERNDNSISGDVVLRAYNRGPLRVRGIKSNDNQTDETPFLGALLFVQNVENFRNPAEKQRVISLQFKAEDINDQTLIAHDQLTGLERGILAGVMQQILENRQYFEKSWHDAYVSAQNDLACIPAPRIRNNHALCLAFNRLFCSCFGIKEEAETVEHFKKVARQKCISAATRQTNQADHFFELLDQIDPEKDKDCEATWAVDAARGVLIVCLAQVHLILRQRGYGFTVSDQLNRDLQGHEAFVSNGERYRFTGDPEKDKTGRPKQRRVWVFSLEAFKDKEKLSGEITTMADKW